ADRGRAQPALRAPAHRVRGRRALRQGRPRHRGAVLLHPDLRRLRQPALSRRRRPSDAVDPDHRHHQVGPAVAAGGGHRPHHGRHTARSGFRSGQLCLSGARTMSDFNRNPWIDWALKLYILLGFAFIFAPIAASFVFSFNVDRFPSLPLGGFSTVWYEAVRADPLVWEGLRNTLIAGVVVSVLATALGFGAAYTDFRYKFFGKQ